MRDYGDRDYRWRDDDYDDDGNRRGTWGQGPGGGRFGQRRFGTGQTYGQGSWNPGSADWDYFGDGGYGGYIGGGIGNRDFSGAGYRSYGSGGWGGYAGYPGDRDSSGPGYGGYAARGPWRGRYSGVGPKNYRRSDERIRDDVNDGLTSADLDARDIDVESNQGIVTLKGSVQTRRDKRHAEDIADDVPGVKDVHNELTVQEHAKSLAEQAKEAVGAGH